MLVVSHGRAQQRRTQTHAADETRTGGANGKWGGTDASERAETDREANGGEASAEEQLRTERGSDPIGTGTP